MNKARLIPLYFKSGKTEYFDIQLLKLKRMFGNVAEFLDPVAFGTKLPKADAVIFPEVLGNAYRQVEDFQKLNMPILFITSEFGTVSMWDWEIIAYLKSYGLNPVFPYSLEDAKNVCKTLVAKRELSGSKFVVFQDNPGEGFQPAIFKRFYWWEEECTQRLKDKYGVTLVKKSFKDLAGHAKRFSDNDAKDVVANRVIPREGITEKALLSAVKIYLALKEELVKDPSIKAMGINCLNESACCDTTPCLAWSILYEDTGLIWGCEADTVSMLTKYIIHKSLGTPVMMTNIYPFMMGMAALKHEKIPYFPEVESDPKNHILLAHCGYFGIVPKPFCSKWKLRPRVLEIVNENAIAIDAELPTGDISMVKIHPSMNKMMLVDATLEKYIQYENSDCLNGAVVKVADGHRLMNSLYSHHYCFATGNNKAGIEIVGNIFGLDIEKL